MERLSKESRDKVATLLRNMATEQTKIGDDSVATGLNVLAEAVSKGFSTSFRNIETMQGSKEIERIVKGLRSAGVKVTEIEYALDPIDEYSYENSDFEDMMADCIDNFYKAKTGAEVSLDGMPEYFVLNSKDPIDIPKTMVIDPGFKIGDAFITIEFEKEETDIMVTPLLKKFQNKGTLLPQSIGSVVKNVLEHEGYHLEGSLTKR